ncbi:ATP-binding protein [Mucilaginibacter ginkgonis]|uniref:histidine kinase n=1 Tax=Mucilaginibacter ginkgonis TaxID=2682091 RepID=A0A6I4I417_9SPHI|nr:ATP-binding protein [Mucilaginibacter ginkgonis]QQL48733.1 PAS domain-containing protein [Mucilaginibacter ginkgonis]
MDSIPLLTDKQLIDVLNLTKVATAIHVTEDAVIQTANQAMLDVWGKDSSVIGKSLEAALPELKGQPFIDMFKRVWNEGLVISGTDTPADLMINGELKTIYFDFEYRAVKDEAGKVICILHTATDISERYFGRQREQTLMEELATTNEELAATNEELASMNEELSVTNEEVSESYAALRELNDNLAESRNELSFAIEAADLGTFDLNPKTGKFVGNARLKQWFGLGADDEIDLANATDNIAEEDRQRILAAIDEAMSFRSGGTYDVEYKIIHPHDKKEIIVRAKGRTVFSDDQKPLRFSGTVQDITDQKRREQYKDDFISVASHELKTPITSLKATLQMLDRLRDNPGDPAIAKLISQANRSMNKTTMLIDDLLNASKVNSGQLDLAKTNFLIAELLRNCCSHIRAEGRYHLNIEGDLDLRVYADEHRIDQVVVNMVNNAVKYAPDSFEITLRIDKADNFARISVIDHGPGINPENVMKLFDRYYRSEHAGAQFSGLGLGLYISAEIIKKHGGKIGVDSELGKGSTFWFTLPL